MPKIKEIEMSTSVDPNPNINEYIFTEKYKKLAIRYCKMKNEPFSNFKSLEMRLNRSRWLHF